jgi:hypothetical protein
MAATSYITLQIEYDPQLIMVLSLIGIIGGIIAILLVIIFLIWYYRATKNIHSIGAKEVTSPRMAVIWWFIPIANLWKPYKVTQQIWKASNPEVKLTDGIEWKNSPSSNIIKLWWVLALVSIFGSLIVSSIVGVSSVPTYSDELELYEESSPQGIFYDNILTLPFLILTIISTILFIRIIRKISTWQHLKSVS